MLTHACLNILSLYLILIIGFITLQSYIGDDGALSLINFYLASLIVAVVSVLVFYSWGIYSGIREEKLKDYDM